MGKLLNNDDFNLKKKNCVLYHILRFSTFEIVLYSKDRNIAKTEKLNNFAGKNKNQTHSLKKIFFLKTNYNNTIIYNNSTFFS